MAHAHSPRIVMPMIVTMTTISQVSQSGRWRGGVGSQSEMRCLQVSFTR